MPRGRTRRKPPPDSAGFILAEAIAALLIAAIALATILSGAASCVRTVAAQGAKVRTLVQEENDRVQEAPDVVDIGP